MSRIALAAAVLALALPATASADPMLPPKGKVYTGVTGSKSVGPFTEQVGKHPSVFESRKAIKKALKRKRFLGKP